MPTPENKLIVERVLGEISMTDTSRGDLSNHEVQIALLKHDIELSRDNKKWVLTTLVSLAVVAIVQLGGLVWWASRTQANMDNLSYEAQRIRQLAERSVGPEMNEYRMHLEARLVELEARVKFIERKP